MTSTRTTTTTVRELDAGRCWELLRGHNLGRLAVVAEDGVDIFPVNYLVADGAVLFRSAPGSKLVDLTSEPVVAFEVDGADDTHRWSVVVRGRARRLGFEEEIETSGVLDLATDSPVEKHNFVRIDPHSVTGRRFRWNGRP